MFTEAPSWLSQSPRLRRRVIKIWRAFLRVQRASLAQAVVVARREDERVLAVYPGSGELRLPLLQLDGWQPVALQVQAWLDDMLPQSSTLQLKAIDGTPGRRGVTFLYSAQVNGSPLERGCIWLEPELAPSALSLGDRRLLLLANR
jgi:hypothetical protein